MYRWPLCGATVIQMNRCGIYMWYQCTVVYHCSIDIPHQAFLWKECTIMLFTCGTIELFPMHIKHERHECHIKYINVITCREILIFNQHPPPLKFYDSGKITAQRGMVLRWKPVVLEGSTMGSQQNIYKCLFLTDLTLIGSWIKHSYFKDSFRMERLCNTSAMVPPPVLDGNWSHSTVCDYLDWLYWA